MNQHVIYSILNNTNNKRYVGRAADYTRRKSGHRRLLRQGQHHSYKLQADYDQHGVEAFTFEILEHGLTHEQSIARETYWIAYHNSYLGGYNMNRGSGAGSVLAQDQTWGMPITEYRRVVDAVKEIDIKLVQARQERDFTLWEVANSVPTIQALEMVKYRLMGKVEYLEESVTRIRNTNADLQREIGQLQGRLEALEQERQPASYWVRILLIAVIGVLIVGGLAVVFLAARPG